MKTVIIFLILLVSFVLLVPEIILADNGKQDFPVSLYGGLWWKVPPGFTPDGLGGRNNPHGTIIRGPFEGLGRWPK